MSLGAIKLLAYRMAGQRENETPGCVKTGRPVSKVRLGRLLNVSHTYLSKLELGQRKPGRALANAMAELGICDVRDWDAPPRCLECARDLSVDDGRPCTIDGCAYAAILNVEVAA